MIVLSFSPTQDDIFTVLGNFLVEILPSNTPVVQGQNNRVSEPSQGDFVIMTLKGRPRLATNQDDYVDCTFTATIAGTVMTVTEIEGGELQIGAPVYSPDVATGTIIQNFGTGTGGLGTYNVSIPQDIDSEEMASGTMSVMQPTQVEIQLDVHGPSSADNAQRISTLMRDEFATSFFESQNEDIAPLYADDPRQIPFDNGEMQYEDRWVISCNLQANQTVVVPQQFADTASVQVINVETLG